MRYCLVARTKIVFCTWGPSIDAWQSLRAVSILSLGWVVLVSGMLAVSKFSCDSRSLIRGPLLGGVILGSKRKPYDPTQALCMKNGYGLQCWPSTNPIADKTAIRFQDLLNSLTAATIPKAASAPDSLKYRHLGIPFPHQPVTHLVGMGGTSG